MRTWGWCILVVLRVLSLNFGRNLHMNWSIIHLILMGRWRRTQSGWFCRVNVNMNWFWRQNFPGWVGGNWVEKYKLAYQQHNCMTDGCNKRVRTVCLCSKDVWICTECFSKHCLEVARTQSFLNRFSFWFCNFFKPYLGIFLGKIYLLNNKYYLYRNAYFGLLNTIRIV